MEMADKPSFEELAKSQVVSVRWQAQMELHLRDTHALVNEALLHGVGVEQAQVRAQCAQAHALAALALAVTNGSSYIEHALVNR